MRMNKRSGFTVVELVVVILLIALIVGVILPHVFMAVEKGKIAEGVADFNVYKKATLALYADTGHWVSEVAPFREPIYYDIYLNNGNNDLATNLSGWSGWDGPYIESVKSRHPWGGWYVIQSWNAGRGPKYDVWYDFEDDCYPHPMGARGCAVPERSARKLDQALDDGDLWTGDIRTGAAAGQVPNDLSWIIQWDAYTFNHP